MATAGDEEEEVANLVRCALFAFFCSEVGACFARDEMAKRWILCRHQRLYRNENLMMSNNSVVNTLTQMGNCVNNPRPDRASYADKHYRTHLIQLASICIKLSDCSEQGVLRW